MSKRRNSLEMEIINWDKEDIFNSSPIIEAKIDMTTCVLLIDTGASISFIDKKFLKKQHLLRLCVEKGEKTYLSNMLGGVSESTNVLNTKNLILGNNKFEHEFKVIDLNIDHRNKELIYDGILGFDFLLRNKVALNFFDLSFAI